MNQNFRNFALWAVILLLLVALFNLFQNPTGQTGAQEITYSQFRTDTNDGQGARASSSPARRSPANTTTARASAPSRRRTPTT